MGNYTENKSGITFENIDWTTNGHTLVDKARKSGQGNGSQNSVLNPVDRQGNPITRTSFGIDAINIDWNGAELSNAINDVGEDISEDLTVSTISTTGDLIKVLAEQQAQIKALSALVKALYVSIVETKKYYYALSDKVNYIHEGNYNDTNILTEIIGSTDIQDLDRLGSETVYVFIVAPHGCQISLSDTSGNTISLCPLIMDDPINEDYGYDINKDGSITTNAANINGYCVIRTTYPLQNLSNDLHLSFS